eukprot:11655041-Alexandrium_andersonii.AAC.1
MAPTGRHTRRQLLASRAPMAKDCAVCGFEDCGLGRISSRFRALGPPRGPLFVGGCGICANNDAERTP